MTALYFYDAVDVGDGRAETVLTVPYSSSVGTSWLGIVEGASVSFGMVLDPHALRLQALSTRRFSNFGYRAALMEGLAVDGIDQIALGGWSDDEAGTDAGAVVFVEAPQ